MLTGEDGTGAAIDVYNAAVANISQTFISGNRANTVAVMDAVKSSYLRLEGNVISNNYEWNNDSSTVLFNTSGSMGNGGNIDFFYNTLINNQATHVFKLDSSAQHFLSIHNSIIRHEGLTLDEENVQNNIVQTDCVFLQEQASLSGNIGAVIVGDPGFRDAANGDYHLSPTSDAIDFCDEQTFIGAAYHDLNGQPRGVDNPTVNDFLGAFDAGAYEQNDDLIFITNFE